MRALLLVLLLMPFAGCLSTPDTVPEPERQTWALDVYLFEYMGSTVVYGSQTDRAAEFLVRVTNSGSEATEYLFNIGGGTGQLGRMNADGSAVWFDGINATSSAQDRLWPNETRLWVVAVEPAAESNEIGIKLAADTGFGWTTLHSESIRLEGGLGAAVNPGNHVQTYTVGVWANGTSFYTNIPDLLDDPDFPAGGNIDRMQALAAATPLPIYVYNQDAAEQPPGSKDTCHFTTITGYNSMLKAQHHGSTVVAILEPEEAYTRVGNEAHFLYGESLIFMNTVVSIESSPLPVLPSNNPTYSVPRVDGDCFDLSNTVG